MTNNFKNCSFYGDCNHKDCSIGTFCLRKYKLDSLYNLSLLSDWQRKPITLYPDADNTDRPEFERLANIKDNIEEFIRQGMNLYLHSTTCGCGKTSWGIKIIQSYFNKIWPKSTLTCKALFISVPRFLIELKNSISSKSDYVDFIKENVMQADLVVWDDIGAKLGTEFELNNLLSIIDGRIALGKSNIYTTNLSREGLLKAVGERLTSRICQYSLEIELHGGDKRGFRRQ